MGTEPSRFVDRLMDEVLRLQRLPKVQIERIVGPVLGMFLPDALGPCLGALGATAGYEVMAPEFPLRRADNFQSTNVDWLLVHRRLGLIVLVELKTDRGSMRDAQHAVYATTCARITQAGAGFLLDDLRAIRDASAWDAKYDALWARCEPFAAMLASARRVALVWLVPEGTCVPTAAVETITVNFRDLPNAVGGDLAQEWPRVREGLVALERAEEARSSRTLTAQDTEAFARHILANLRRVGEMRVPVRFWLGRSGSGERPNYQVEFADGSVQAYWNGGACHAAGRFHTANLGEPLPFPECAP